MRFRQLAGAGVGLALALLSLAGCGGGQQPGARESGAGQPSAQQPSGQQQVQGPIKIGAALSLSGSYERFGKNIKQAYELWAEHVNARGGLLGRKVELVVYDDQSEPETGAKLYEKLITADKVDLLLGPYSTAVTLSATNVTEKYKFPMLAAGASGAQIWNRGFKYVFGFYTQAPTYAYGALELAKARGYQTVALVNEDTAFPQDVVKGAEARAREMGFEVVFKEQYPKNTTDFSVLVQKLKGKNPDVVIGGTYAPDSMALIRQAKDLGFTPKLWFLTTGPALPEFGPNLGQLAENVMGNTEWETVVKAPGVAEFVKAFKDKYGNEPGYHAAGGYASGQVLEAVVQKAGGLDREKLREAFATVKVDTVFGPYQVDDAGRQIGKPNFAIQWQGGKRVVVWPQQYASGEAKLPFAWGK